VLGGSEIHPISVRVGGFYKAAPRDLRAAGRRLQWALDAALETVKFVASLPLPELSRTTSSSRYVHIASTR
jgi:sulfhydrogenase subunit alpha